MLGQWGIQLWKRMLKVYQQRELTFQVLALPSKEGQTLAVESLSVANLSFVINSVDKPNS